MSFDARLSIIGKHKGYDYEELTIDATVGGKGFTTSKLATQPSPKRIYITVETAQCRFCYDNTAPTSSVGHPLNPFDTLYIEGLQNMKNFRAIRTGNNNAKLVCTYEVQVPL